MTAALQRAASAGGPAEALIAILGLVGLALSLWMARRLARGARAPLWLAALPGFLAWILGLAAAWARDLAGIDAVLGVPVRQIPGLVAWTRGGALSVAAVGTLVAAVSFASLAVLVAVGARSEPVLRRGTVALCAVGALAALATGSGAVVATALGGLAVADAFGGGGPPKVRSGSLLAGLLGVVCAVVATGLAADAAVYEGLVLRSPPEDLPRLLAAMAARDGARAASLIGGLAAAGVALAAATRGALPARSVFGVALASVVPAALAAGGTVTARTLGAQGPAAGLGDLSARVAIHPDLRSDASLRIGGGCLLDRDDQGRWTTRSLPERPGFERCRWEGHRPGEPVGPGALVVAAADTPGRALVDPPVAEAGAALDLVTTLPGPWPPRHDRWRYSRVSVQLAAPGSARRPVAVLDTAAGDRIVADGRPVEAADLADPRQIASLLGTGRRDVVLVPGPDWTVEDIVGRCLRFRAVRPLGTRCLLGLGGAAAWQAGPDRL